MPGLDAANQGPMTPALSRAYADCGHHSSCDGSLQDFKKNKSGEWEGGWGTQKKASSAYTLSCHACLVVSCLVLIIVFCLVMSCLVFSCIALSCMILPCLVLPCVVLCVYCVVLRCVMSCCLFLPCPVLSCCLVLFCLVRRILSFPVLLKTDKTRPKQTRPDQTRRKRNFGVHSLHNQKVAWVSLLYLLTKVNADYLPINRHWLFFWAYHWTVITRLQALSR